MQTLALGLSAVSLLSCCSSLEVSEELRQYLKTPTFDNW